MAVSVSKKRIRNKYEVFAMQIISLIYQLTEAAIQECSAVKVLLKCCNTGKITLKKFISNKAIRRINKFSADYTV